MEITQNMDLEKELKRIKANKTATKCYIKKIKTSPEYRQILSERNKRYRERKKRELGLELRPAKGRPKKIYKEGEEPKTHNKGQYGRPRKY
jgi:hypothetical protein